MIGLKNNQRDKKSERPPTEVPDQPQLEAIRQAVQTLQPADVNYYLPNLVESIKSASEEEVETVRFHIGISFTADLKPLDYRIDQVIIPEGRDHTRIISLKDAVSRDHYYFAFPYPTDRSFSPEALRAAMLAAIENDLIHSTDTVGKREDESGWISTVKDLLK